MSIVLELQKEIISDEKPLSSILLKAKLIAFKLGINDIKNWIDQEINGYDEVKKVPSYRVIKTELRGLNMKREWILTSLGKNNKHLLDRKRRESVSMLEDLIKKSNGMLAVIPVTDELNYLAKISRVNTEFQYHFSSSAVVSILNSIKDRLLNWSLELEKNNILGKGLEFSREEKENAGKVIFNIISGDMNGHIGKLNGNLEQNIDNSVDNSIDIKNFNKIEIFTTQIDKYINELDLDDKSKKEILDENNLLKKEIKKVKPDKNNIKNSIEKISNMVKKISGDVASNIITSGILQVIAEIMK